MKHVRAGRTAETGHCADLCRPVNMLWHIYEFPARDRLLFDSRIRGQRYPGGGLKMIVKDIKTEINIAAVRQWSTLDSLSAWP